MSKPIDFEKEIDDIGFEDGTCNSSDVDKLIRSIAARVEESTIERCTFVSQNKLLNELTPFYPPAPSNAAKGKSHD